VDENIAIKEIVNFLGNIKVKNKMETVKTYKPEFKNTYRIVFYNSKNEIQYISIFNHEYIEINNKYYKIIGNPNLNNLYNMIVADYSLQNY